MIECRVEFIKWSDHCLETRWMPHRSELIPTFVSRKARKGPGWSLWKVSQVIFDPWLTAYINVSPLIRQTTGLVSHNANTL